MAEVYFQCGADNITERAALDMLGQARSLFFPCINDTIRQCMMDANQANIDVACLIELVIHFLCIPWLKCVHHSAKS